MQSYWLTDVRLETGAYTDAEGYGHTQTDLFDLKIENGKITEQVNSAQANHDDTLEKIDAKGKLAVPAFKEMHNHLDKTYLSLPWRSTKLTDNLKDKLHNEAMELVEISPTTKQRASAMIDLLLSHGATHIRTHVNIDDYIGLKNLEGVLAALEEYKGIVTHEVIAFPQHGLLTGNVPKLMREAMRNGATMVGGLDPAGIDGAIEKSLDLVMDIAAEFDADIDVHIHDHGHVGWYTIDKWIDMIEDAGWKGRCAVSHGFSLGGIPEALQHEAAKRLKSQEVSIMSNTGLARVLPPFDILDSYGVPIHFGFDGFYDSWSSLGSGDLLEKVRNHCIMNRKIDEHSIRKSLKFITKGITPLNDEGKKVWPQNGDAADFVFSDASCSAELIARLPKERTVMVAGKVVTGEL